MKGHIHGSIRALLLLVAVCLLGAVVVSALHAEAISASNSPAVRGAGFAHVIDRQIPQVTQANWARNPVDKFVLARLEAARINPAPPAAPEALIRRAYFDLIGLPPTPQE